MAIARPMLAIISLILVAGGVLLSFFTILSGSVNHLPIDKFYFLQTTTNGIPGARNPTRWTFLAVCGEVNGRNGNCGGTAAALPFDPPRNFHTDVNVPSGFIGTHYYYYMSRFMFAFYLISLFFAAIALFSGLLAMCSRLGGYLTGLTVSVALFFQVIASSLQTAWVVKGRDAFRGDGQQAYVGKDLMAFAWTIVACYFLATIFFCMGGKLGGERSARTTRTRGTGGGMMSRFRRGNRSTKSRNSRGSFLDSDSQRRVKDDYA